MTYLEEIEQKLGQIQNAFINCDSAQFTSLQSQLNQLLGKREGYNVAMEEVKSKEEEKKPDLKVAESKKA
tara:strand:- start:38 stop:247 length:210 start_codon:yes stop_codon:yes gene_type:complete